MINNFKKQFLDAPRGFTLLETLIAVLILMSAIAGPLTIVQKAIQSTTLAKNQDTAYFLAQEAIEYVRFVRDTNNLSGGNWLTGSGGTVIKDLTPCISVSGDTKCTIDSLPSTIDNCTSGTCVPINFDQDHNFFSYTLGTVSIFTRTVSIKNDPAGITTPVNEAILTVTVSWCDQASVCTTVPRKVVLREDIFDSE